MCVRTRWRRVLASLRFGLLVKPDRMDFRKDTVGSFREVDVDRYSVPAYKERPAGVLAVACVAVTAQTGP